MTKSDEPTNLTNLQTPAWHQVTLDGGLDPKSTASHAWGLETN